MSKGSKDIDYVAIGRKMGRESRIAQGLPPTIEDTATLARIAQLLHIAQQAAERDAQNADRPMRKAALELLRRQHEETGAPMTCQDPAIYAAVAKLLCEPSPPERK